MFSIYTFWHQTVSNFGTTGAIAPSSPSLSKSITQLVSRKLEPAKILEIGPGTGVFTKKLLKILGPQDQLDLCEINPRFVEYLTKCQEQDKDFKEFPGKIQILPIDIQTLQQENYYDYIISGLPLNAFPPEMVENILEVYLRLIKPWGWISYFEYIGIRSFKTIFSGRKEKERLYAITKIVKHFIRHHEVFHKPIWFNVPPAYVRHCQKQCR